MLASIFTNREHKPVMNEVLDALGARAVLWQKLTQDMAENYAIPEEWNFGGKSWNMWYRKSGKTLVTLYPQAKGFVAQIVLGKEQAAQALAMTLGKNAGTVLRETPQLHDGRWLFIKVKTAKDISDIEALLALKRRPKH